MTKATETLTYFLVAAAVYGLLLLRVIPTPDVVHDEILPVLPWWALVSFGAYSMGTIGYGVYRYRNCEDAYYELMAQIDEAKRDLYTKGIVVS